MRGSIFTFAFLGALLLAGSSHANTGEPPAEPPADCVAADAAIVGKLEPIRSQAGIGAVLTLGDVLAALSRARALCEAGEPERGMLVYLRISDALSNAAAIQARGGRP